MEITLRPDHVKLIEGKVRAGEFATADDVVASALEMMITLEALSDEDPEAVRRELAIGIAEADRGQFVEFTAEDIKAEGRKRLSAKKAG